MFKNRSEIIVIQAEAKDPIPTKVVFWSHDKGTAKLIFELQKDRVGQPLAEGTIVPICLDFVGGRHIYHAVIEDALNGIVSIILEDNILGYQGKVDGSIYIELPDQRSLDTAGRFTFDIKRSPIDEEVPELEDYYWQGFNEIMESYHQTIAGIKSEAKELLDSLKQDVSSTQEKVSQLEQSISTANTNLNARIDEIRKKIDENDVYTKAESSANVIYQLIGKEKARITLILDFKDKIVGSVIENPNLAFYGTLNGIPTAAVGGNEEPQSGYDNLSILDGKYRGGANTGANTVRFSKQVFDILESVKGALGEKFFSDQGAYDDKSKVVLIRSLITRMIYRNYGFGSGPNGQKITTQVYANVSKTWSLTTSNITNEVREMSKEISKSNFNEFISEDGKTTIISFAEPSDNITASAAYLDYSRLEIEIELSANEVVESIVAAYHRENIATQEEAENGESDYKLMTPETTKQAIEKRSILLIGDQNVDGAKNFLVTPTANNKKLLTVDDYSYSKNLYKGAMYFTDTNSIPFSMNDVKTGLVFVLGRYNSTEGVLGTGFYTHIIRKEAFISRLSKEFRLTIADTYKSIFISDGLIKGEVDNYNDATKRLFAVVEVNAI